LFLAAIISAALSTISSLLNSQSMIIWNSILKRFNYFKLLNDDQSLKINRIVILIIGIFCTCFSFIISRIGNNIFQVSLGLLGAFGTPIISLFVLSYFFKYSNVIGAFVGTFCGFVFVVWISIGSYLVKPIYPKLVTNISGCNFTNFTFERLDHNYSTFFGDSGESINVFGFNKIYTISFASIPLFGFMITIVIGLFSSLLTSNKISKSLNLIRS
jgi:Na+/proline symporter